MNSYKNTLLFFALVISTFINAQAQEARFRFATSGHQTFPEIKAAADSFFTQPQTEDALLESDNEFKRYKRWEWFWQNRVMPDGSFPDLLEQKRIYDHLRTDAASASRDINSPWTNINQTSADGGYNGMGRATSVAFHPTDPLTFYVGAPIGGIWKTIDGGQSYSAIGDSLPYVSTGNICVDQQNPDNIYITVGDHTGWWNYGLGVFKSSNGGETWSPTTQVRTFQDQVAFLKMAINPFNGNEVFVAETDGLYRTQDGGETWSLVHAGAHRDVIFQPENDSTLYCATEDYFGSSEVYISYNNGDSWEAITDFNASGNYINLTVTPADNQYLGILATIDGTPNFYVSTDGGFIINEIGFAPEDGVIFFSPNNVDIVYNGYLVVNRTENGGFYWQQFTDWYDSGDYPEVHADNHFVTYHPLTHEVFFCNDGGVYKFNENTYVWTELTDGLITTQFYHIAVSQVNDIFMIGGTQDNGGRKRISPTQWAATNGGDAMEVAINQDDDDIIYTTYIYGQLYRSLDQWDGDTYHDITPSETTGGAWVTPYVLQPSDNSVIIAGYEDVFRSINEGDSWTKISDGLTGSSDNKLDCIAVANTNDDVIYATRGNTLYYTLDGGNTWDSEIILIGATNGANSTSIAVHPTDPMKLWVTISGYANGKKVFYSENAGVTFANVSYNLPNVPVNASVIDRESPQLDLYVGTDVGVFVLNTSTLQWDYYGEGMPNTSVTDLEIQYSSRKLRAGTFGRGIWENDLLSEPGVSVQETDASDRLSIGLNRNPVGDALIVDIHSKENVKGDWTITSIDGSVVQTESSVLNAGNYQRIFDVSSLVNGIYLVQFTSNTIHLDGLKFLKQ